MKISFVIPAHNEEAHLERCLSSVFEAANLHPDMPVEIIVVNNASTDHTADVAKSFEGVTVVNEQRKGLTFARQAGFEASTGDLIANVDADCVIPEEWMDFVIKEFADDASLVALSGPQVFYDLPLWRNIIIRFYYYIGLLHVMMSNLVLHNAALLQGGNFILRRDALEHVGGFNLALEFWGEDADIARRLLPEGRVKFTFQLPMYASGRRIYEEGMAKTAGRYVLNYIWTIFFRHSYHEQYADVRGPIRASTATTIQEVSGGVIVASAAIAIIFGILAFLVF